MAKLWRPSAATKRLGALARRLGARARPILDLVPLSPLGLFTLAGAGLALAHYGLGRIDLLLLVVGVVGLALGVLSLLGVITATLLLRARLRPGDRLPALRLEAGVPSRSGSSLPRLVYVPLVKIDWSWIEPAARVNGVPELLRVHEEITPERRALVEQIVRRVEVADVFGLCRMAFVVREPRSVTVLPSKGALQHVQVIRSIAGGDDVYDPLGSAEGERVDTRAYVQGDPMRLVLWKVYARSRQLVVRTPERAFSVARKTIAYLVAGPGDEPAAGAARVAVESGALGGSWVLGADGNDHDATTAADALDLLARSASSSPEQQGAGLEPFLRRTSQGGAARAVVFVPGRPGPWLERVLLAIHARPSVGPAGAALRAPVELVVGIDGLEPEPPRSFLRRLLYARAEPTGPTRTPARDLAEVMSALTKTRARVTVVDRASGRVFGDAHRKALLAAAEPPAAGTKPSPAPSLLGDMSPPAFRDAPAAPSDAADPRPPGAA